MNLLLKGRAFPLASWIGLGSVLLAPSAAVSAADPPKFPTPTAAQRQEYIRRSQIWQPTDVASKDLYNGPTGELKFAVDEVLACDFVPKPMAGWTEKFLCR